MKLKKLLAAVLTMVMVATALPVTAFAETKVNCPGGCNHVAAIDTTHYDKLQDAVDAAEDKDTITMIGDHTIDYSDATLVLTDSGTIYNSLILVSGKDITVNLNGHKLYGTIDLKEKTKEVVMFFATKDNGHLVLDDSVGDGEVKMDVTPSTEDNSATAYAYALLFNYGGDSSITVNGGNYKLNKGFNGRGMVVSTATETITVNDGVFYLGNLGDFDNGSPWIFNASGQNERHINVNGGTFNADILHQYYPFEVETPQNRALRNNGDGTWTMVDAVAYVNEQVKSGNWYSRPVGYATLEEAIAAVDGLEDKTNTSNGQQYTAETEYVTLLKDCTLFSGEVKTRIEVGNNNLIITGGTVNEVIVGENGSVKISGGTLKFDTNGEGVKLIAGCEVIDNNDGTWTVGPKSDAVASVGDKTYSSLQEAINEAKDGDTIYLLVDNGESITVSKEVEFTLEKLGNEFEGSISAGDDYSLTETDGKYTFTENDPVVPPTPDEPTDTPDEPTDKPKKSSSKKYSIDAPNSKDIKNGKIELNTTNAKKNSGVEITVIPDPGYALDELKVLDKNGDELKLKDLGNGVYRFTMPKGNVDIEVSFVKVETPDAKEETMIVLTIGETLMLIDGEYVVNDVAPIIRGERTVLPIRVIAEALGATVTWNEADQTVTIVKGDDTIVIYIGQAFALVNGEPVQLDQPAFIENGRTYLPLRFIMEQLGANVAWDALAQKVTIIG